MQRGMTTLILLALIAGLFAVPSPIPFALAQEGDERGRLELIVQAEAGSVEALVDHVQSLGGQVKIKYRNVPAVAVSIPASQRGALSAFPGVIAVEKDRQFRIADAPSQDRETSYPQAYAVQDASGVEIKAIDPTALDPTLQPEGYAGFVYTGAPLTWEETLFGAGSVVAVVDTGTVPNICLVHAVIGATGYPDGYNATGDGIPATNPSNHYHGTAVGSMIASGCALDLSGNPDDVLWKAISAYLPWPADSIPLLGQAPLAMLYPVKVLNTSGSGSTSGILDGLDHILTLKKDGVLDIDIVNMSLGGATLFDGGSTLELFLKELYDAHILVVSAAGNSGPWPNSSGSPATSLYSLSVGALDYAPSSRVLYEYLGLVFGVDGELFNGDEVPGMGLVMRPMDEVRVANFSARGPTSDGRGTPDISALGMWNFTAGPTNQLLWVSGTSLSSPTVAGVAALINAYQEFVQERETWPLVLRDTLLASANPQQVGELWRNFNDQGYGAVDAVAALERLKNPASKVEYPVKSGKLKASVLGRAVRDQVQQFESEQITLAASQTYTPVFEITPYTNKVTIEVFDIQAPDNSGYAYFPNALEFQVQDGRRTDFDPRLFLYWYPYFFGDSFTIEIEDGWWLLNGEPVTYAPMQPGLMKVSFAGDYGNESPASFKVRISRENFRTPLKNPIAQGSISQGQVFAIPVEIPEGMSTATFDLVWKRDWSMFPTSDIDMLIFDPQGNLASLQGASGNAPERAILDNPAPGTWMVSVEGFEMYKKDTYQLFMSTEAGPYPAP